METKEQGKKAVPDEPAQRDNPEGSKGQKTAGISSLWSGKGSRDYILLIVITGLLISVEIVLERYLRIISSDSNRYSLAFIARAVEGSLLGPVGAGIAGLISDTLGTMIRGDGAPIPMLAASAFLRGAIYGLFLYKRCTPLRIILAVVCVEGICSILLNSLIIHQYFGMPLEPLLIKRIIQAGIITAVQIPVLLIMRKYLFPVLRKMVIQYRAR